MDSTVKIDFSIVKPGKKTILEGNAKSQIINRNASHADDISKIFQLKATSTAILSKDILQLKTSLFDKLFVIHLDKAF